MAIQFDTSKDIVHLLLLLKVLTQMPTYFYFVASTVWAAVRLLSHFDKILSVPPLPLFGQKQRPLWVMKYESRIMQIETQQRI